LHFLNSDIDTVERCRRITAVTGNSITGSASFDMKKKSDLPTHDGHSVRCRQRRRKCHSGGRRDQSGAARRVVAISDDADTCVGLAGGE